MLKQTIIPKTSINPREERWSQIDLHLDSDRCNQSLVIEFNESIFKFITSIVKK